MPKPAYRIILGVFLLSFVVASCGNKKSKEKEAPKDTIMSKPVDPGTTPTPTAPDTVKKKPVDPGT